MAKTLRTEQIDPRTITTQVCVRAGCTRTFVMADGLPAGWVHLITHRTPHADPFATLLDVTNGPFAGWDSALCPEHAREFDGMMKDVGQHLREVEGSA